MRHDSCPAVAHIFYMPTEHGNIHGLTNYNMNILSHANLAKRSSTPEGAKVKNAKARSCDWVSHRSHKSHEAHALSLVCASGTQTLGEAANCPSVHRGTSEAEGVPNEVRSRNTTRCAYNSLPASPYSLYKQRESLRTASEAMQLLCDLCVSA